MRVMHPRFDPFRLAVHSSFAILSAAATAAAARSPTLDSCVPPDVGTPRRRALTPARRRTSAPPRLHASRQPPARLPLDVSALVFGSAGPYFFLSHSMP
ncbi:hypothetical protein PVAP13_3KG228827 [Panicum virgatum]|uniref:Secreted protein n=1 Tax=Panicum virgatum TaxID=38727 RepID=A0A8T0V7S4_PANVG|nr:hypothetical protein PVAP13_3KG228827 [Panicum virgatum]